LGRHGVDDEDLRAGWGKAVVSIGRGQQREGKGGLGIKR
jgi:hypothetical protein